MVCVPRTMGRTSRNVPAACFDSCSCRANRGTNRQSTHRKTNPAKVVFATYAHPVRSCNDCHERRLPTHRRRRNEIRLGTSSIQEPLSRLQRIHAVVHHQRPKRKCVVRVRPFCFGVDGSAAHYPRFAASADRPTCRHRALLCLGICNGCKSRPNWCPLRIRRLVRICRLPVGLYVHHATTGSDRTSTRWWPNDELAVGVKGNERGE